MSAIFLTVMTLCEAGDHLVVSSQLYGGTVNLFRLTLPKFGIECTFVKPRDTAVSYTHLTLPTKRIV